MTPSGPSLTWSEIRKRALARDWVCEAEVRASERATLATLVGREWGEATWTAADLLYAESQVLA